jgi:hypothetical protein
MVDEATVVDPVTAGRERYNRVLNGYFDIEGVIADSAGARCYWGWRFVVEMGVSHEMVVDIAEQRR